MCINRQGITCRPVLRGYHHPRNVKEQPRFCPRGMILYYCSFSSLYFKECKTSVDYVMDPPTMKTVLSGREDGVENTDTREKANSLSLFIVALM